MAILSIFYFGLGNLYLILMGLLIVGGGIGFVLGVIFLVGDADIMGNWVVYILLLIITDLKYWLYCIYTIFMMIFYDILVTNLNNF